MPDIAAIGSLLSSVRAATDIAKLLREAGVTLDQAEIKLKIADLVGTLADAKMEIAAIQGTIEERDKRIQELEQALELQGQIQFDRPYYWRIFGSTRDGPFCQQCYDAERKLIRLQGFTDGVWNCVTCKNTFADSTHRPERLEYPDSGLA